MALLDVGGDILLLESNSNYEAWHFCKHDWLWPKFWAISIPTTASFTGTTQKMDKYYLLLSSAFHICFKFSGTGDFEREWQHLKFPPRKFCFLCDEAKVFLFGVCCVLKFSWMFSWRKFSVTHSVANSRGWLVAQSGISSCSASASGVNSVFWTPSQSCWGKPWGNNDYT